MTSIILAVAFVMAAPIFGGLLAGADRIVTARMQGRVGPPLLQPFYDVGKLFTKAVRRVNPIAEPLLLGHVAFMVISGVLIVGGADLVFSVFVLALAALFLVLAAGSVNSPYSHVGAGRELVVLLASEPFFILMAAAICKASDANTFLGVMNSSTRLAVELPGALLAFLFVITIKLRKSPFDISTSHHAHQELVRGLTTDMSGRQLAWVELAHWYESAILAVFIVLFFNWSVPLGVLVFVVAYALEVLVDNSTSRAKWQLVLRSTWTVTLVFCGGNLVALFLLGR
jgi:formate hydrogenlyase subunit 4